MSQSGVARSDLVVTQSDLTLQRHRLKRRLPVWLYSKIAPVLGKQHVKNAQKMEKTMTRGIEITKIFEFFVLNEWIYECRNFRRLIEFLRPE